MECDQIKPRTIKCEGMKRFMSMPCMRVQLEDGLPDDETRCVDWRRAVILAEQFKDKRAPYECRKNKYFISQKIYAVFKWKTKTMYFFVEYRCRPPVGPGGWQTCAYLFKSGFRWDDYTPSFPCAGRVYPKMREAILTKDGMPKTDFPIQPFFRKLGLDPFAYSADELKNVGAWERAVNYYDYEQAICQAKYEHMGQTVTIKKTGETGVVVDIGVSPREYEFWDPDRPEAGTTATAKHRLKVRPLAYKIQLPDKTTRLTTFRAIEILS